MGIFRAIRHFLFSRANREFLIFFAFLVISGIFWLMMTLNDVYNKETVMWVKYVNVPKNAVLTSNETDSLRITISDKGFNIVSFLYTTNNEVLEVDFNTYAQSNGTGTVSAADLRRLIQQKLPASTKLDIVKPEKLTFYYNYGERRKVPVRLQGEVTPQTTHYISSTTISPDSVYIYASKHKLDSIKWVDTEDISRTDVNDTLLIITKLQHINGVKMVPDRVNVTLQTDILTEGVIEGVPICGLNMPEGKVLRTFPAKVTIHFVTGMKNYRTLTANDFLVVADYEQFGKNPSAKCAITLRRKPESVMKVTLETNQVDYLIEELR